MNQTELLDQFVVEARECLETIGARMLDVEREPTNEAWLNDLFRSVHTLKGNCGLFEFKPLERVVHAGEDLLDQVRHGALAYSGELVDALLDAMDYSAQLIDEIERSGRIDDAAEARSIAHANTLRALLGGAAPAVSAAVSAPAAPAASAAVPPWFAALPPAWLQPQDGGADWLAVHYRPDAGCFFNGEDPWRLATTVPGLQQIRVGTQQPWPAGEALADWDCYQCNLQIELLSSAPRAEVEAHFRCVPEQVALCPLALADAVAAPAAEPVTHPGDAVLRQRAAALWAEQCAQLARGGLASGTLTAGARVLGQLCTALGDTAGAAALATQQAAAGGPDEMGAKLLAWARAHAPGDAVPAGPDGRATDERPALAGVGGAPPPTGRGGEPPRGDDGPGASAHKVLKVGQEKIDRLMDLIGEMVVAKNSLPYLALRAEEVFQQRELAREIKAQYAVINRIAEDMQHAIMQVRMLPVGTVFQRFGRLVRDISKKLGKEVQLVLVGEDTEADKNVIEALADPLIHILRNSLDHGIELPEARRAAGKPAAGTIRILARQESDRVIIEIEDDGAGVNAARVRAKAVERGLIPADRAAQLGDDEAVQLIFLPGFSTAEAISDLSGRGVGMDVVRTAVERINGSVELASVQGRGTTIRLSLPLSMAVTHVMVIECAGRRLGVPMDLIVETVRVHADDIHHFKQSRTTVLRGRVVPLRALHELLALDSEPLRNDEGELAVLVVRIGHQNVGLMVDQFDGAIDIILKPLEGVLAGLTGFSGSALMGDGGVLMVLNPKELLSCPSAT